MQQDDSRGVGDLPNREEIAILPKISCKSWRKFRDHNQLND